ncbi:hypothetical protein FGG79_16930 [Bacillus sp. BHET2]|nr:hypothetical protein FGG79_16930 [Bacillus sp. BHET2]
MLDSCGNCGKVETPQGWPEEAQLPPRGKRAPAAEINHHPLPSIATKFTKRAFIFSCIGDHFISFVRSWMDLRERPE